MVWITLFLSLILGFWISTIYNRLLRLRREVEEAHTQVLIYMQREQKLNTELQKKCEKPECQIVQNHTQIEKCELEDDLAATRNKLAVAKQIYHDEVMLYNLIQEELPSRLFSKMFGHRKRDISTQAPNLQRD